MAICRELLCSPLALPTPAWLLFPFLVNGSSILTAAQAEILEWPAKPLSHACSQSVDKSRAFPYYTDADSCCSSLLLPAAAPLEGIANVSQISFCTTFRPSLPTITVWSFKNVNVNFMSNLLCLKVQFQGKAKVSQLPCTWVTLQPSLIPSFSLCSSHNALLCGECPPWCSPASFPLLL